MNREIRTDLAIELRENVADRRNMPGVKVKTVVNEDRSIKTTTITVLDEIGEKNLGKAKGQYITIECSKLKEYEESIHEPLRAWGMREIYWWSDLATGRSPRIP